MGPIQSLVPVGRSMDVWHNVLPQLAQHVQRIGADVSRCVVLLPYAQLLPLARVRWAQHCALGLLPQFETTSNWAARIRPFVPDALDISFDAARDWLRASALLQQAGQTPHMAGQLASRVQQAAVQLSAVAAAMPPAERTQWMQRTLPELLSTLDAETLRTETTVASVALAWAASSAYATDVLWPLLDEGALDALVCLSGFQHDALSARLLQTQEAQRPGSTLVLPLAEQALMQAALPQLEPVGYMAQQMGACSGNQSQCTADSGTACHASPVSHVSDAAHASVSTVQRSAPPSLPPVWRVFHPVSMQEQALLAAACVQQAVQRQNGLVALVDTDRALTRHIRALLAEQGIAIRDETGWKLSTTLAGSHVMAALRACVPRTESETVLAWLKLVLAAQQAHGTLCQNDTQPINPEASAVDTVPAAGCHQVQLDWVDAMASAGASAQVTLRSISPALLDAVERHLRRYEMVYWPGWRHWQHWVQEWAEDGAQWEMRSTAHDAAPSMQWAQSLTALEQMRQQLQAARPLSQWLADMRLLLQASGQWQWLQADAAGQSVLQALHLDALGQGGWQMEDAHCWSLRDFTHWVTDVLEAASFKPAYPLREQVVITPLSQLLARPFATVVIAGCDAHRLPAAPEPGGDWTRAQRSLLGLPERASEQLRQRSAWQHALHAPHVDVLYSHYDHDSRPLSPSPLLQEWQLRCACPQSAQQEQPVAAASMPAPLHQRHLPIHLVTVPAPQRGQLAIRPLSASSYEQLRNCPYQFFGRHLLGLRDVTELDATPSKRDLGNWLHLTLELFHQRWHSQQQPSFAQASRHALEQALDDAAHTARQQRQLDEAAFLPYAAVWPAMRDGYIQWLQQQETTTHQFAQAEAHYQKNLAQTLSDCGLETLAGDASGGAPSAQAFAHIQLRGSIDRIDRIESGTDAADADMAQWLLLDYKTESDTKSRQRVKDPSEDTQLAFYAALMAPAAVQAGYVNVGERGDTKLYMHADVMQARNDLLLRMAHDVQRVLDGHVLPALGQGSVCDYCSVRGLCRKDFWEA